MSDERKCTRRIEPLDINNLPYNVTLIDEAPKKERKARTITPKIKSEIAETVARDKF